MPQAAKVEMVDSVAVMTLDNPPVNALSAHVRSAMSEALAAAIADAAVGGIVIQCAGRTFFSGADISEFGAPLVGPPLQAILDQIERAPKPVVAAIHGAALGGGFELALCCHYRVMAASAKVGLPEVNLGILPGAGGTQRVPRLIGAERALEFITSGRPMSAQEALEAGLADAVVADGELRARALRLARETAQQRAALPRARDATQWTARDRGRPELFEQFRRANAKRFRGFKAPWAIVEAVEAAVALPFDAGLAREAALFEDLVVSPESAAQRAYFFAERQAAKIPDLPAETQAADVRSVGVIGAGTMGAGIAIALLTSGLAVTLVETSQEALSRGEEMVRRTFAGMVARGRLAEDAAAARLAGLTTGLTLEAVGDADLVIEAVYESLDLKKQVFARLDAIAKRGAILASNTSFLDIDEIAAATARPEAVLGLHFFSPANVMRLLEIVRGRATSAAALATGLALARKLGKVGVVSKVCPGFIANRLMLPRALQADGMALEGTPIEAIDRVLVDYGFPMGHFQMMDLAGLDVVARGRTDRTVMGDLVAAGRLGQKSDAGYYDYDEQRRGRSSEVVAQVVARAAEDLAVSPWPMTDDAAILDRLLLPVVNEGFKILEDGVAIRPSDVDVVAVLGYSWPVYRGGPISWAEQLGLREVVDRLGRLEAVHGPAFAPCKLLIESAGTGAIADRYLQPLDVGVGA